MSSPQPLKLKKRKTLTPYVSVWVVLGGFAIAYLALLGFRPDALAKLNSAGPAANQQRNVERALADLDPLRNTLGEMKMDVANLKTELQVAADRHAEVANRLNHLEGTGSSKTSNARRVKPAMQNSADAGSGVQILNGNRAQVDPINTASLSRPAIALAATQPSLAARGQPVKKKVIVKAPVKKVAARKAPAKKPPKTVGVQLATGPSIASLQLNWSVLADRNNDALGHLQPRYTTSGKPSKKTYDLVAGPLGTAQQAEIICKVLSERVHSCKVGAYHGSVLPPT